MQDDNQTPQSTPPTPGVSAMGQQPYTVEQPQVSAAPIPAASQTVFSPGDVLHPQQPADAAVTAVAPQTPQSVPSPSIDQSAAWAAPVAPALPAAPTVPLTSAAPETFGTPVTPTDPLSNANVVMPGTPIAAAHKSKILKLPLIIVGGLVVLAAAGFAVYRFVLGAISIQDVTAARTSYNSLSDNAYDAGNAMRDLDSVDTTAAFDSKLKVFEAKIADAEKQYDVLKNSPVQHNKKVHEKFVALDKKWRPYIAFLRSNVKDAQTLMPVQIAFESTADDLSKSAPSTTAQLSTYLTSFKKLIDDTSADLKDLKMTVPENQMILEALQKFMTTASDKVAAAQKDLAAGASTYTITSHIYDLNSASYDLSSDLFDIQDQLRDKTKLLDPTDEFDAFGDSLLSLYSDLSK